MPIARVLSILVIAASAMSFTQAGEPDYERLFAGRGACFEIYDLNANTLVARFNPERCAERTTPCSTFKVPLALMAFDAGILVDETSAMKWDGTKTGRDVWDRDQTAASWMRDSVVWFSQRLTPKLGMARVKDYLGRFEYGNQDMSGGLTTAWLESSLSISADEQLRFWKRLWRGDLPVSRHAIAMTKTITFVDRSPAGWTLHGKTGSGAVDSAGAGPGGIGPGDKAAGARSRKPDLGIGWFVGHVSRGEREYVFVTSYTDRAEPADRRPAGWIARDLTKTILEELGLR